MSRLKHPLISGLLLAVAGALFLLSPWGKYLEEEYGLGLMFKLRGRIQPPANSVVINIDNESSTELGLPDRYNKWPRSAYSRLIRRLNEYGAAVIVFDLHFADRKQWADDRVLADTIGQANNVILFEKLVREQSPTGQNGTADGLLETEKQIPPIKIFGDKALACAPFPIPKIPVRINQAWTFKTSAGDTPTLPVVALQALALDLYDQLYQLLSQIAPNHVINLPVSSAQVIEGPGLVETMRMLRVIFQNETLSRQFTAALESSSSLSGKEYRLLQKLCTVYSGENNIYINYYGPPATITTYSFHEVVSASGPKKEQIPGQIKDSVVFIGAARTTWSEQKDGFFTVFSQPDGLDLSGVELLATVFANLFQDKPLKPLSAGATLLVLLVTTAVVWSISYLLPPLPATIALGSFITGAVSIIFFLFSRYGLWVPVITLLILLPAGAFLIAMLYKYIHTRTEQQHIKKALKLYLPDNVVEEISRDLSFIESGDRMVYGVCLLSDAQNYTTLSEILPPSRLSRLMKEYFGCLFNPVNTNDGLVCNVIGDAMFALWPSTEPQTELRIKACQAAIQIPAAIDQFNREHPDHMLPTRVGLHSGYLIMGNIGAEGHFEYAPVGDIVNTASRIEGLNKKLNTRVLASEETIQDIDHLNNREVGTFLLSGKNKPVTVYELITDQEITPAQQQLYNQLFPEALAHFRKQEWEETHNTLHRCIALQPDDGPSLFYRELCNNYVKNPPEENINGVIRLSK